MGKGTMVPGDFYVDQDVSITRIIIIFDKPVKSILPKMYIINSWV